MEKNGKKNNANIIRKIYVIIFIIFSFFTGLIIGINYKTLNQNYIVETLESNNTIPSLYTKNENEQIYLIGLSNIISNKKDLDENHDGDFVDNLIKKINYIEEYDNYSIYRDLQKISKNGFSILKCKSNNKIYFSKKEYVFDSSLCELDNEKIGETFTRTYRVLNVEDSNDGEYFYVTVRQFQCEGVETVKISKDLCFDIKENNNYEFTFQFTNKMAEDNIQSIFENTTLLKINFTDREGVDQIQDSW